MRLINSIPINKLSELQLSQTCKYTEYMRYKMKIMKDNGQCSLCATAYILKLFAYKGLLR